MKNNINKKVVVKGYTKNWEGIIIGETKTMYKIRSIVLPGWIAGWRWVDKTSVEFDLHL